MNSTKGIIRKEKILAVADEFFSKKGVNNSSVDEIAKAAKIAKSSFYHYFKSKDELLMIVVGKKIDQYIDEITKICDDNSLGFYERLRICLMKFYTMATNAQWINEMNFGEASPLQLGLIDEFVDRSATILAEYMKYGAEIGLVHVKSPKLVTFIVVHGIKDIWKFKVSDGAKFESENRERLAIFITTIEEMFHMEKGCLL